MAEFKYLQVEKYIEQQILNDTFKEGDLLPSEAKFCEMFRISRRSVRRAYANLINRGILHSVRGKGSLIMDTRPVKIKLQPDDDFKNKTIGMIFHELNDFFLPFVKQMEFLLRKGKNTLIPKFNQTPEMERSSIEELLRLKVDAIIITPQRTHLSESYKNYEFLTNCGVPVIYFGKPPFNMNGNSVYCNDFEGAFQVTQYLLKHNDDVVFVTNETDIEAQKDRYRGYSLALEFAQKQPIYFNSKYEDFDSNFKKYLQSTSNKKLGFYCIDDWIAARVFRICIDNKKKIPDDAEIIGYNNLNTENLIPVRLSTVEFPAALVCGSILNLLSNKQSFQTPDMCTQICLLPKILWKDTTLKHTADYE